MSNATDGPVHEWFGLSYTNYQVIPRTLMQSMPTVWQERIVACLEELRDAYEGLPQAEVYEVHAATEHLVDEMTTGQLDQAGITADWYGGQLPPQHLTDDELSEWLHEHENPDGPTYHDRFGNTRDGSDRVTIRVPDPVPHYNRGRTYLPPASEPDVDGIGRTRAEYQGGA